MCKQIKYKGRSSNPCIDECMRRLISRLEYMLNPQFKTVSCYCGHGKYPMTIVIKNSKGNFFELFSGQAIKRTKRFYKRDNQGYYYIPEVTKINKGVELN